ncbi:S9 family peptidase [Caulobacter sp. KR2-114]|uniref:S9 family peptidase n=1 Tax=Caulobacter sp. KR2-114 TaxID=3400912 RepID=UPI003BFDB1D7
MKRRTLLGFLGAAFTPVAALAARAAAALAPVTPTRPARTEQFGRLRIDDYAWLKPANWKEVWRDNSRLDPAIRDYLAREDAYAAAVLAPTAPIQARLLAAMKARLGPDAATPALVDGPFAYLNRFAPGATQPQHLRRPAAGGTETLLVDLQARAAGHAFFNAEGAAHSPDHGLFAWAEDVTGAEKYQIFLKDLATGQIIDGPKDAFGDFVFSADGAWLFWTWRDADSRPSKVFRRPSRGGPDTLVYAEADPGFLLTLTASNSRRWLFLSAWNDVTSEVRLIDARAPEAPAVLVEPRTAGHKYSLEHWRDHFVVLTNADGAVDFKLMTAPEATPGRAQWQGWRPEQPGRTIIDMRGFADGFLRVERVEGNPTLVITSLSGADAPVAFDEAAYELSLQASPYDGRAITVTYESPRQPRAWLSIDLASGARTVLARPPLAPALAPDRYDLKRIHARAGDGAEVPITVLCRKGLKPDGRAPLLLTGYGAYGDSYATGYSIPNLALVDQGWVWAVAHVRGGSEKGRGWFEAARALKKKTSFTDFIACAEALIAAGYGARGRVVAHGYSAGGLLVGAALNLRPDLWGAVIGQAPFVDMLNTMSDTTHPLVPLTWPVWGNPLADVAVYDYIASYSPYENVQAGVYPPVLATTAVGDDRVGFWEPAKWIAALRARTRGGPKLLACRMAGGHGGGGRMAELELSARMYAFAIWALAGGARRGA